MHFFILGMKDDCSPWHRIDSSLMLMHLLLPAYQTMTDVRNSKRIDGIIMTLVMWSVDTKNGVGATTHEQFRGGASLAQQTSRP